MNDTIYLHYGRHTLRVRFRPDGKLVSSMRDMICALCAINGLPSKVDAIPEEARSELIDLFESVMKTVIHQRESQAFGEWLDKEVTRLEKAYQNRGSK